MQLSEEARKELKKRPYIKIDFNKVRSPEFVSIVSGEGPIAAAITGVRVECDPKFCHQPMVHLTYYPLGPKGIPSVGAQVETIEGYLLTAQQAEEYLWLKQNYGGHAALGEVEGEHTQRNDQQHDAASDGSTREAAR